MTDVPADAYAALELDAERRGMTVVSLAGMILADHAAGVPRGAMCTTLGHELEPAAGEAFLRDGDGAWHPYCGECVNGFARDGDRVRRYG
jgi:hypothetical protein